MRRGDGMINAGVAMAGTVAGEGWGETPLPLRWSWAGAAFDGGPESIAAARRFAGDYLDRLKAEQGVPVAAGGVGAGYSWSSASW